MDKKMPYEQAGGSVKGIPTPRWLQEEDDLMLQLTEEGMEISEICTVMRETFSYRPYTYESVKKRRLRLGKGTCTKVNPANYRTTREDMIKEVEEQLAKKNITLVEYKTDMQIFVKCNECGEVSKKIKPNVTSGTGCKYCIKKPGDPEDLYLIEFPDFDYSSTKIGISYDYECRKITFPPHTKIKVYPLTYAKAKRIEDTIKEEFKKYRTDPHELINNGSSECFDISLTQEIKERIECLISQ